MSCAFCVVICYLTDTDTDTATCIVYLYIHGHVDGKSGDTAELFERVSNSIKVKRYSEAINDLNTAIEADPSLSEAYWRRASVLRQLCRFLFYLFSA